MSTNAPNSFTRSISQRKFGCISQTNLSRVGAGRREAERGLSQVKLRLWSSNVEPSGWSGLESRPPRDTVRNPAVVCDMGGGLRPRELWRLAPARCQPNPCYSLPATELEDRRLSRSTCSSGGEFFHAS